MDEFPILSRVPFPGHASQMTDLNGPDVDKLLDFLVHVGISHVGFNPVVAEQVVTDPAKAISPV